MQIMVAYRKLIMVDKHHFPEIEVVAAILVFRHQLNL
jgi:hypothetical protein